MTDDAIKVIFKFGQREYMEQLLYEGLVYMNTVDYFAKLDDGSRRCDPNEGLAFWAAERSTLDIEHNGAWLSSATLAAPMRVQDEGIASANLYCLHARTSKNFGSPRLGVGRLEAVSV
jgi:hypothetical protein